MSGCWALSAGDFRNRERAEPRNEHVRGEYDAGTGAYRGWKLHIPYFASEHVQSLSWRSVAIACAASWSPMAVISVSGASWLP